MYVGVGVYVYACGGVYVCVHVCVYVCVCVCVCTCVRGVLMCVGGRDV